MIENDNELNQPLISNSKDFGLEEHELDEINKKIRNSFIAKVFGILLFQITLTFFMVFFSLYSHSFQQILLTNSFLYIFSLIIIFGILIMLCCNPNIIRSYPYNYIILIIFTLCLGYTVAMITCLYDPSTVLLSLFMTIITVLTLTLYAMNSKTDFTIYGGVLFVLLSCIIFGSIIMIFFPIKLISLIIDIACLVLFSIYLIYDVQLLVGGKRIEVGTDDYVLVALNLYLDIINIFIEILSFFNRNN